MGRPSKLTEKQCPEIDHKFDIDAFYQEALEMQNNERAVTLMLKLMLACGDLRRVLGVPRIDRHRFEFSVGGGRIDLLLFHPGKSVSIVEVKAEGDVRTIMGGIGQLCMYAVMLPAKLHKKQQPKTIRRILCAPLEPSKCVDLIAACAMAGVRFVHLPAFSVFKSRIDALSKLQG